MFSGIYGHKRIIEYFKRILGNEKLSHAYIFDGLQGIGKYTFALEIARTVFCTDNLKPCNKCSSCVKFNSLNHPDFYQINNEYGDSIKNAQIEEMQSFIHIKPYESDKKVIIINNAEDMTTSAQNRILKIMEEPPGYAIIILVTSNITKLLPTIKSRCERVKFNRLSKYDIEEYLKSLEVPSELDLSVVSEISDGSVRRALSIYGSDDFSKKREFVISLVDDIIKSNRYKLMKRMDFFDENKENVEELIDLVNLWLRDLLMTKLKLDSATILNKDKSFILKDQSDKLKERNIISLIESVNSHRKLMNSQVNFSLCLDSLFIDFQEVRNG